MHWTNEQYMRRAASGASPLGSAPHPDDAVRAAQSNRALSFPGCRILVAEDDPVSQEVAVRMLTKFGCRTDVAATGHDAVLMQSAQPYDLILMDCQMPQLDGYQAVAQIRAMEQQSRRPPIVALTASATESEKEKCITAGMDDLIAKPLRMDVLREVLTRWLQPAGKTVEPENTAMDELDAVHAMFGADFAELAMLYQRDGEKRVRLLREAARAEDSAQVAKLAHVFSGSCAAIGAVSLSAQCKELEVCAKAGALDRSDAQVTAIEAEYHRISAKLRLMLG